MLLLEFAANRGFIRCEEEAEAIERDTLGEMLVDILRDMRDDRIAAIADIEKGALVLFAAYERNQKLLQMVFQKLIRTEGIGFALFHICGVGHIVGRHIDGHAVLQYFGEQAFFLGGMDNPTPIRQAEINRILGTVDELQETTDDTSLEFALGEVVKVNTGPFSGFNGTIEEINTEKKKLKVMVKIFGRSTPVELGYTQVDKE